MEKALRKARSDLTLSGIGSIAFGIWYFVKTLLYNLFARNYVDSVLNLGASQEALKPFLVGLWLFMSALTMALYLYTGLRAVSEGTGKEDRRRIFYLVVAGALLLGNGASLVSGVRDFSSTEGSLLDRGCDILLSAARLVNMAALLRAARLARKLTQNTQQEVNVHAD